MEEPTVLADVIAMECDAKDPQKMGGYFEQLALGAATVQARAKSRFEFVPTARQRAVFARRVARLLSRPQLEQRSVEWHEFRRGKRGADGIMRGGRLTASDTGTILGLNKYACPEEVIVKKAGVDTFSWSPACEHGTKYEEITLSIYRSRERCSVHEFGCIPHDEHDIIAMSPDGIRPDGVMVEIKNVTSRKITGVPTSYYYAQMQQQLEVGDFERCDFVETKIVEYANHSEFAADHAEGEPDAPWTARGTEKGVLLDIVERVDGSDDTRSRYIYAPLTLSPTEAKAWVYAEVEKLGDLGDYVAVHPRYWRCLVYSNVPVYRDRVWWATQLPKLEAFWERVEEARRDPAVLEKATATYKAFAAAKEARFGAGDGSARNAGTD